MTPLLLVEKIKYLLKSDKHRRHHKEEKAVDIFKKIRKLLLATSFNDVGCMLFST